MEKNKQPEEGMERWGTATAWAREFGIGQMSIKRRIEGVQGITGRGCNGHIFKDAYYSESTIRKTCVDLLQDIHKADKNGFFTKNGERFGTIKSWARVLNVGHGTISNKFKNINGIRGRDAIGIIRTFYAESKVKEACNANFQSFPIADKNGFFELNGERFGTLGVWAKILKISRYTIVNKIQGDGIQGRERGKVRMFYSESAVFKACGDHIQRFPKANKEGFLFIKEERLGTIRSWRRVLRGAGYSSFKRRFEGIDGVQGKANGTIRTFYPESAVRSACSDLPPSPRKNGKK